MGSNIESLTAERGRMRLNQAVELVEAKRLDLIDSVPRETLWRLARIANELRDIADSL